MKVQVSIGRTSGPCTDREVVSVFDASQVELIKDVIGMVNAAAGKGEDWYVTVDGRSVIPVYEAQ